MLFFYLKIFFLNDYTCFKNAKIIKSEILFDAKILMSNVLFKGAKNGDNVSDEA